MRDPQTLNLYAYARNNPLSIRDLDGHGWWKDLWNALADSTYRPLVTLVSHPLVTGRNLGSAITHPIATANAIKNGVVTTTISALHGNGTAIGTAIGTVGMAFIPGLGEAGEGAEAAADVGLVSEATDASEFVNLADQQATTHILQGDATGGGHAPGLGIPGKSKFPAGWSNDKIMQAISDVATDPASRVTPQGGRSVVQGTRDGIAIKVVIDNKSGRIITGYPTNIPRNP